VNPRNFREYDIRGVADVDLDDETVRAIGMAIGTRALSSPVPGGIVVVGRDCRVTSPRLFAALTDGIRVHAEVIDIGVVPSPVLYFAAHHLKPAAAVMITGSHNPPEDNGFKLMLGTETLYGAAIQALRADVEKLVGQPGPHPTRPMHSRDMIGPYGQYAMSQLKIGPRKFKLVLDAGNGAGGPTAVGLYKRLGFEVVPLYCDLDGTFPNHHPDPTQASNLKDLISIVKQENAELGIALDGDADRIGVVDGTGRVLWGDQIMIILGKALLEEVPGAKFVAEVKCSQTTFDVLAAAGGSVEMWKVGHSLIKAQMKETGALLAGEMSGHIFFAHRWLGFDDGIYAGARLLELLSNSDVSLATRAAALPVSINTPEIRIDCPDDQKQAVVAAVVASLRADPAVTGIVDIDGVRASFEGGWGLVRASNTQAVLVMRCEAVSEERLAQIRAILDDHIARAKAPA
jgi:phosphomannomutase/phosphoglucomutase